MNIHIKKIEKNERKFWDMEYNKRYSDNYIILINEVKDYIKRAISPFNGGKDIRFFDQIQFLKKHFSGIKGKRVLEPACGTGVMGCFLAKYEKCYVEGIDISPKGIQVANKRKKLLNLEGKINFSIQSFYHTNFPDNYFDLIIGNSLHHLHNYDLAGREMCRLIKKGGKAVFVEPYGHNYIFNFIREHNLFGAGGGSPNEYGNYFTKEKIKTLANYFSRTDCEEFRFFMIAVRSLKSLTLLNIFDKIDSFIIKYIPCLKKYFGFIGIVLYK